jgi:hypothetical protein
MSRGKFTRMTNAQESNLRELFFGVLAPMVDAERRLGALSLDQLPKRLQEIAEKTVNFVKQTAVLRESPVDPIH